MKQLYPYQQSALDACMPVTGRPLIVVPTGGGKSLINAHLAANNFTGRTLCLTHVEELVLQNEAEMRDEMPFLDVGVYCAGLGRKEADRQITIGSVASVYRNIAAFEDVTQVIVDEAHRVSVYRAKMYKAVLEGLPNVDGVCGLTATPFRLGTGLLHQGPEAFFDRVAYEISVRELIDGAFLAPLVSKSPRAAQLPTADLTMRGGEYTDASLAELVAYAPLTQAALRDALPRTDGRRHILVFACNVDHAKLIVAYLKAHGELAEAVYDGVTKDERRTHIAAFKRGDLRWLVNVAILTTGFNFRALDCIVVLRPTASPVVYVQINGRGTRIAAHKQDCLILDYGGNVERHGMFDDPNCGKRDRVAVTTCEKCETCYPKPHICCPGCGTETPKPDIIKPSIKKRGKESDKLNETPFEFPVLSDGSQWRELRSWTWRRHVSAAGNTCLLIKYRCVDGIVINEFLLEGKENFNAFMAKIFSAFPKTPCNVTEAIAAFEYCVPPRLILAKRQENNTDYWRVLNRLNDQELTRQS